MLIIEFVVVWAVIHGTYLLIKRASAHAQPPLSDIERKRNELRGV
jgi:hypothetical protein